MRATLRLSSPAWLAQPRNTSSTELQSTDGLRSISALIGTAARSSARTADKPPPNRLDGGSNRITRYKRRASGFLPVSDRGPPRCELPGRAVRSAPARSARRWFAPDRRNGSPTPVAAMTCSRVTPGCSAVTTNSWVSASGSVMHRSVIMPTGPAPGRPETFARSRRLHRGRPK